MSDAVALGPSAPTDRYIVISADTHNAPPSEEYRQFVEPRFLADFDEHLVGLRAAQAVLGEFDDLFRDGFAAHSGEPVDVVTSVLREAPSCSASREWVAAQEADGVVGSVLQEIPHPLGTPFARAVDPRLRLEGMRAYNRWLAAFCSEVPGRAAGVMVVPRFSDVDLAVLEIVRFAEEGVRGGVALPAMSVNRPGYHDPIYDPVWAVCEAYGLPLVAHFGKQRGGTAAFYGSGPLNAAIASYDVVAYDRRPLWLMILGGVFDRFPGLRLVFTEQFADWVPFEVGRLRNMPHNYMMAPICQSLSLTPEEYWYRNCVVCASFMSRAEADDRHTIGIANMLWGSDFPHPEGTYPHTGESLRHTFSGIPPMEVQAMLGTNAARVHGFDLAELAPVAAGVGPTVAEVAEPYEEGRPPGHWGMAFRP